ncbi:hypothetical protein LTSEMON_0451 [Salmonella enterica subsp. enterica serovar Montevideo str. S5-403]|uniref:Uncharacterized protein n=1 Tax=Salmonella enterica subsp. enterica serovar Montevideo str. S5-403 TaxID=913242 RepID=G5PYG8_SALMO|nr:hypothetical protein LTSEMIN_0545 [Salmonella enterica subsp. enterica serovar Minnesota str. A4-603]EHC83077.1 hypothetical protein LTSEMON_0451 [Salmonella enterica subsp. enterica serovar Montevideo str. S5-403]
MFVIHRLTVDAVNFQKNIIRHIYYPFNYLNKALIYLLY